MATVYNIDWPSSSSISVTAQQNEFIEYLNIFNSTNINAIMFQVRPVGDAFYQSDIEPWSKYNI